MKQRTSKLLKFSLSLLSINLLVTSAFAGETRLYNTYSAVAVGDGGAGGAALANDASSAYTNPAGMIRVPKPEIILSGSIVDVTTTFRGTNTWTSTIIPFVYTQNGKANGGATRFLPSLFATAPINNLATLGFSLTTPFGLGTYYSNTSIVRYSATTSELKVFDYSPNVGFKINDQWSLGVGIDFDNMMATLRLMGGLPPESLALDTLSKNDVRGWGYGGHIGVLYQYTPTSRLGVTYRSQVSASLTGNSYIQGPLIIAASGGATNIVSNHIARARVTLPATTDISAYHEIDCHWAVEGNIEYQQWSNLSKNLYLYNVASLPTNITAALPQNFRNSWIVAVGANFKANDQWLVRAGTFFDETPIKNRTLRSVNLPDSNRVGLSIGAHFQGTKELGLDAGYTHLFFAGAGINHTMVVGSQSSNTNGSYSTNANIFAAQLTWDII